MGLSKGQKVDRGLQLCHKSFRKQYKKFIVKHDLTHQAAAEMIGLTGPTIRTLLKGGKKSDMRTISQLKKAGFEPVVL